MSDWGAGLLQRVKAKRLSRQRRLGSGELKWGEAGGQIAAWESEQPVHGHNAAGLLRVTQGAGLKSRQL